MGTICRQKTCERGTFAVKMMVFKRVRGWTFSMRTVPIQNFVEYPPGKKSLCIETTHTTKRCLLTSVWQHFFTFRYMSILSNIFWSTAGKCWDFRNSRHHGTMEGRVLPSNGCLQFQEPKNTFQQQFYNAHESHMESKMERCEKHTRARGEGVSPSCPPLFCCAHISCYTVQ